MTKTQIDFNNGKKLSIEENKSNIVITLNKDMINHVKFVFEDSGIPGIVGPHLYMNAKDIVEKYLKECKNEGKCKMNECKEGTNGYDPHVLLPITVTGYVSEKLSASSDQIKESTMLPQQVFFRYNFDPHVEVTAYADVTDESVKIIKLPSYTDDDDAANATSSTLTMYKVEVGVFNMEMEEVGKASGDFYSEVLRLRKGRQANLNDVIAGRLYDLEGAWRRAYVSKSNDDIENYLQCMREVYAAYAKKAAYQAFIDKIELDIDGTYHESRDNHLQEMWRCAIMENIAHMVLVHNDSAERFIEGARSQHYFQGAISPTSAVLNRIVMPHFYELANMNSNVFYDTSKCVKLLLEGWQRHGI